MLLLLVLLHTDTGFAVLYVQPPELGKCVSNSVIFAVNLPPAVLRRLGYTSAYKAVHGSEPPVSAGQGICLLRETLALWLACTTRQLFTALQCTSTFAQPDLQYCAANPTHA